MFVLFFSQKMAGKRTSVMLIVRIGDNPGRRMDLLLTSQESYYYALLYFTGSDKLNIIMRRRAQELGYSLNEHGMKGFDKKIKSEKDIFEILGMKYMDPIDRDI